MIFSSSEKTSLSSPCPELPHTPALNSASALNLFFEVVYSTGSCLSVLGLPRALTSSWRVMPCPHLNAWGSRLAGSRRGKCQHSKKLSRASGRTHSQLSQPDLALQFQNLSLPQVGDNLCMGLSLCSSEPQVSSHIQA